MSSCVQMEIITPSELFYEGEIVSLVCTTTNGEEGFLPGRLWCCKLLSDEGRVRVTEKDGTKRVARIRGGYVEIRDKFVIFSDEASWVKAE